MTLRLGTRKSELALTQSGMVARAIGPDVELVGVTTEGDRLVDVPLDSTLRKGFFTEALEAGLRDGTLDLAVHSLKDLPLQQPEGLVLAAVPPRESLADLLLVREEAWDAAAPALPLRAFAKVGAASERRQWLVRTLRADCDPAFLRGNVPTRVGRLREGKYDAIVLAEAGVRRLGLKLEGLRVVRLLPTQWPNAAGQGALALQCRADDRVTRARLEKLHDPVTAAAVDRERGWLGALGGGCSVPFGAAVYAGGWAMGLAKDGAFRLRRGVDLAEGDTALRALLDGDPGEGFDGPIWEVWNG
ncbi:MAG: hydroxymethylbilane synthase [Pseudomonadota bacterium]|nr:hydroxymethylbilane synthase [Pseudomonadota bacterium]